METSMTSRVKTELPTYFRVGAINSRHLSPLSNIVAFYLEKGETSLVFFCTKQVLLHKRNQHLDENLKQF